MTAPTVATADTLVGVVQEALETNPELGAIRFNRRAIDNELNAARGLKLPTVDLRADAGRARNSYVGESGLEDTNEWHNDRSVGAVVSQRLFDGFEARHEIARQKNRVESARWRVNDTANSIALRAVQAYLEVIRADLVLKAARSNLTQHQTINSRVSARVDQGKADAAEGAEAGARTAAARAIVAEAEARLQDALALFKSVVGRLPGRLAAAPAARGLPGTVEAAVQEAVEAAPSVVATQFDAIAAQATIGYAYSRFFPKLNLELSTDHGRGVTENNDRDLDARAMLVVRWNLFNGGIDKARFWEAKARAAEAAEISANTGRIVERETRVSWNALVAASQRVPDLRRQLELQKQRRSVYLEQFDTGQRLLLDILDAQSEIFLAESSLRTEELIGLYSGYRLLAAMGRLVPALGLELPAEAAEPHAPTLIDGWRTEVTAWPRADFHTGAVAVDQPAK
ncbi:MAG: TolC family outer membrane protein [Hyphomicrobiaceae bacterium]|nr:TolC family outer membrane protein [Hyphomicrobiaceae bacterium]